MTDEPEWAEARRWWYSQTYIGLEMVKLLGHRELVYLEKANPSIIDRKPKTVRCCAGYTLDILKSNMAAFHVLDYPFVNMYYSVMHLDTMPLFSYAPAVRAQKYTEWTNGGYQQHWQSYDFCIDLDGDSIEAARQDLLKIKMLYDEYKLPYSVRFSGNRGFHICIDSKWLPQLPETQIVTMLGELATMMKQIDGITSLDDSIFDSRRVLKLPYSFCLGNIVLPLDDEQIENFSIELVKPENVLSTMQIKDRGLLERHSDQTPEQARASFLKMASNFIDVGVYIK